MRENLYRFSAVSIISGDVPSTLTFCRCSGSAMLFGVWPPIEMITPDDRSAS